MKGILFTEFMDMVEDVFSNEVLESIIAESDLPSGGVYTAIGTYHHSEIVNLVVKLSEKTEIPVADLLKAYGKYLFGRFTQLFPKYFEDVNSTFEFLKRVDNYIHVEVKKLYPDAELPCFKPHQVSDKELLMDYYSSRHFEDVACGLIEGCCAHFDNDIDISYQEYIDEDGTECVRFTLVQK